MESPAKEKKYSPIVIGLAIAIPLIVGVLSVAPKVELLGDFDYHILPFINAWINGITFVILVFALRAIKSGNIRQHKRLMHSALIVSLVFLVLYVTYHASTEETRFGGQGSIRYVYFFLLLTHIVLAAALVPLVAITYFRALAERFDRHRKIARITMPVWMYVSITGVIVYLMISPYYP